MVHFPTITKLATRRGIVFNENCRNIGLVRKGPFPYTTLRRYALDVTLRYKKLHIPEDPSVAAKLLKYHVERGGDLSDQDVAAELADHFMAGANTTVETLTYLLWEISRPILRHIQDKLSEELKTVDYAPNGAPYLRPADRLPYLDAVIKETLRVCPYAFAN
jgi:cytochrome P450